MKGSGEPARTCVSCGTPDASIWGVRDGNQILECTSCGLTFFEDGDRHVRDYETYYTYTQGWDAREVEYEVSVREGRIRRQLGYLGRMTPGRRIVDIGAGPGYFCSIATRGGWDALGVEVSTPAVEIGKGALGVRYVPLEEIPDLLSAHLESVSA